MSPSMKENFCERGLSACAETERVYRNILDGKCITGHGLLKARLFTSTLLFCAYCRVYSDTAEMGEMAVICSGMAWHPFKDPNAKPRLLHSEAEEIALPYMKEVMAWVSEEMARPSSLACKSKGFEGLLRLAHDAYETSVGAYMYRHLKPEIETFVESMVWSNLRLMEETEKQIQLQKSGCAVAALVAGVILAGYLCGRLFL